MSASAEAYTSVIEVSAPHGAELTRQALARLRHLMVYGSANKYRPVNNCKNRGGSGE